MTISPNRSTLCHVEQRSIVSILSHFEPFLSEALIGMRKSEGKGTSEAGYSLSPLFLPKWHLTHKSFMLLIVQRCPWPVIPQPPLFTKFLRPGRIDYLGHVIHIEGGCVPELIITTLAVLTQTAALCIACPSAPQALQAERIWAKTGHVRDYEILPSRDLEKTWEKSSHVIGKLLLV